MWNAEQEFQGAGKKEVEMPKDFDQFDVDLSIEVRAEQLRQKGGVDTRPSKIPEEDKAKTEEQAAKAKVCSPDFAAIFRGHSLNIIFVAS